MRILGISEKQDAIIKMINNGCSYSEVSVKLNIDEDEVIYQEMMALESLSSRYSTNQSNVIKIIKSMLSMLLIVLCSMPVSMNADNERAFRVSSFRISRTTKGKVNNYNIDIYWWLLC